MNIELLELRNGRCPVAEFLDNLELKAKKKVLRTLELIDSYPTSASGKAGLIRKMSGYERFNLFEIRISYQKIKYRIFYCFHASTCFLVHAFKKTTKKTPLKEIQIAVKRIQNYLNIS